MDPIIKVDNLKIVYEKGEPSETTAVENATFQVFPEEFIIIFGPSGCGKSTVLYAIAGIERNIEGGTILLKGEDITQMTNDELAIMHRDKLGIIFQAYNLIPTLNVIDNITLPLVAGGANKNVRERKAKMIMSRLGISQYAGRFPQNLSGGQQQRVDIARALITDPDIILADEPTGNLDSQSADIVMNTLATLNESDKKAVVLVTHDPSYLSYAHRIIYMKDGKVVREALGRPKGKKPVSAYAAAAASAGKSETTMEAEKEDSEKRTEDRMGTEESKKEEKEEKKEEVAVVPEIKLEVVAPSVFVEQPILPEKKEVVPITPPELENPIGEKKELLLLPAAPHEKGVLNTTALGKFFDWHFDREEEDRLTDIIEQYATQKISKHEMVALLNKPFKEGGAGFYRTKAIRLSNEIADIVNLSASLKKYISEKKDMHLKVKHVSAWLLNDYGGRITSIQSDKIDKAILKRIEGKYNKEEFQMFLDAPMHEGGVGMHWQSARHLAVKLEMVLG